MPSNGPSIPLHDPGDDDRTRRAHQRKIASARLTGRLTQRADGYLRHLHHLDGRDPRSSHAADTRLSMTLPAVGKNRCPIWT